jgi:hypothetical protein
MPHLDATLTEVNRKGIYITIVTAARIPWVFMFSQELEGERSTKLREVIRGLHEFIWTTVGKRQWGLLRHIYHLLLIRFDNRKVLWDAVILWM